jgi:hypothetical protein
MKPRLVPEWKRVLRKAWSVRLNLIAALLSSLEAGWQTYVTGQPPIIALATAAISIGAAIARIVAQKGMDDAD